jgi:hypothetical protein
MARKISVSVAASTVMVAIMPRKLIAPRIVRIFQLPSGVASCTRAPFRLRAKRLVICVETPLSSRKISFSGSVDRMRSRYCWRRMRLASVSRSVAWSDFF